MEQLNKHQLVLVALLVSFVTSLATGIVTVALMDQAPAGVTRTITQVIQQTVADATGASSTAAVGVAINVNDQVANATAAIAGSIVHIRDGGMGPLKGLGLIVSKSGTILTDKNLIDSLGSPVAVYPDGKTIPISVVRFQMQGDVAFLSPIQPLDKAARPITFSDSARLGASVWALSGTSTYMLSQGIVSRLDSTPGSDMSAIQTSILGSNVMPGAPLFDAVGAVIGIGTTASASSTTASFYPLQGVKDGVPQ